jgi:putative transposase
MKHGLVRPVRDWPHSSFHRDVRTGILLMDWAGDIEQNGEFGERR